MIYATEFIATTGATAPKPNCCRR